MLLVTFHGGKSPGINNVYAYDTPGGAPLTQGALTASKHATLSELRAMVLANGLLYVANGAKSESTVLAYTLPSSGFSFTYAATLIGPDLSSKKDHFKSAIAHPFGIAFDGANCYISNQDTDVVGLVAVTGNGTKGKLVEGPPKYLSTLFGTSSSFLNGTYVASQIGVLPNVDSQTTVVDHAHGGLAASLDSDGKVKNSVRDVAIANGMLFVCDEPEKVVNFYSLVDGSYLGSSNVLADSPTHLAISNGGLYVSAGATLYWGSLPSTSSTSIALTAITPTPPSSGLKIGGISFDDASNVYVPYQTGSGGNNPGGSIYSYTVGAQSPPVLSNATAFATDLTDTPEFVLYWSGPS
jgi:hypothetical protein